LAAIADKLITRAKWISLLFYLVLSRYKSLDIDGWMDYLFIISIMKFYVFSIRSYGITKIKEIHILMI